MRSLVIATYGQNKLQNNKQQQTFLKLINNIHRKIYFTTEIGRDNHKSLRKTLVV